MNLYPQFELVNYGDPHMDWTFILQDPWTPPHQNNMHYLETPFNFRLLSVDIYFSQTKLLLKNPFFFRNYIGDPWSQQRQQVNLRRPFAWN